jgi:hypothetical protein
MKAFCSTRKIVVGKVSNGQDTLRAVILFPLHRQLVFGRRVHAKLRTGIPGHPAADFFRHGADLAQKLDYLTASFVRNTEKIWKRPNTETEEQCGLQLNIATVKSRPTSFDCNA